MLIEREQVFSFISDGPNVFNKSADGSSFYISYSNDPITIDKDSIKATCEVMYASIWNTFYNVTSLNNQLSFKGSNYSYYQPSHYYLELLNQETTRINVSYGVGYDIIFSFDGVRQRIQVISASGGILDFNVSNSIATLLGWIGNETLTLLPGIPQYAPNTSDFRTYQDIYVHCDIVNNGANINAQYNSLIDVIPNFVGPLFNINYDPNQVTVTDCLYLKDSPKSIIRIWITDKDNKPLITNIPWEVTIKLRSTRVLLITDKNGRLIN
jgi:hypothetical protein